MKSSSWDKQLGLASPLELAAGQSNQTTNPSKNEVGLDVSHHTRVFPRGGGRCFFLDILFHRMSVIAILLAMKSPALGMLVDHEVSPRRPGIHNPGACLLRRRRQPC